MKDTFPQDRELSEGERIRIFKADKNLLKHISDKTGIEEDEIKRRGIHVGLPKLAELLGIDLGKKKAA